ncbi:MAG: hypothetical protein V1756_00775 [Patescibacteria group bacterium]
MADLNYKFNSLKNTFAERGFSYAIRRGMVFLFSPLSRIIKRNDSSVNFFYGTWPNLVNNISPFFSSSGIVKFPKSELVKKARNFWYANVKGDFNLDGEKISRNDIFIYGGPNPKFKCEICQKSEWLSRVRQKDLFIPHSCPQSDECKILCSRQGDEFWANLHQNFDFSIGCDPNLPAPKCLVIMPEDKNSAVQTHYERFLNPGCDQWMLVLRRRLAFTCQVDIVHSPHNMNWQDYDFVLTQNIGKNAKFPRPSIPVIMYGHDFWPLEDRGFQWMINWLKPDVLLTPYPAQWQENYKLSGKTKVIFYPFFDSAFFARPNLDRKELDLLVIGAVASSVYSKRVPLDRQISNLRGKYKIGFSHRAGMFSAAWHGPTFYISRDGKTPVYYLNKWSEYLGSAHYVMFGKMKFSALVGKYYEVLGSGAVPIFPEVTDLKYLGIKPFEHYIPLSEVEGNNEKLEYYLAHYDDFRYIAVNSVNWYKKVSDKMIFNDFEDLIGEITNNRFPKRII